MEIIGSDIYLPLIVFLARVMDVSLGTIRIIFISRGKRFLAPILGFIESFIWIFIVSQVIRNINSNDLISYVAYAGGFAAGTAIGMIIEEKLALGILIVRTILGEDPTDLVKNMRKDGYGVTCVEGEGSTGPVTLVYSVINRKNLDGVIEIIKRTHPKAFITIEELRSVKEGVFPTTNYSARTSLRKRITLKK